MDARERRLAENEMIFREVNEQIKEAAASYGDGGHLYEFLCECANRECTLPVESTLSDYESVRADPHRFMVRPEHHFPEVEKVVERHKAFWVVEKEDAAADFVECRGARRASARG